ALEKIPELISRVQNGADIALATPCINSESSDGPGVLRRIILAGAALLTRTLFRELRASFQWKVEAKQPECNSMATAHHCNC
ncbi:MAG: hypothetical protein ACXV29_12165, partial [Halobacteriota archaeon]